MVHIDLYFQRAVNLGLLTDGGPTFYAMGAKTMGRKFTILAHTETDSTIVVPSLHPGSEVLQVGADYFGFLDLYCQQTTELNAAEILELLDHEDARPSLIESIHEAHLDLVEKIKSYLVVDIAAELAESSVSA